MDKRAPAPIVPTLVADALRAARDLGLGVGAAARARKGTREEIRIEIRHGGQRIAYTVEAKRALTPATLGAALHELAQLKPPALLVADYVTPPMAERLREAGVEFFSPCWAIPPHSICLTGNWRGGRRWRTARWAG